MSYQDHLLKIKVRSSVNSNINEAYPAPWCSNRNLITCCWEYNWNRAYMEGSSSKIILHQLQETTPSATERTFLTTSTSPLASTNNLTGFQEQLYQPKKQNGSINYRNSNLGLRSCCASHSNGAIRSVPDMETGRCLDPGEKWDRFRGRGWGWARPT